ncbi:MAG TPA: PIN domain-containing protein [Candidatus Thermoplasmatota archaeon]|nr:PIN domain-containing protein [Candidatus Thermoplasmatota archaeon]
MILDTPFLVDVVRGDPAARALLEAAEAGSEALRVPAPVVAKFWEAVERARAPPRDVERAREILLAAPGVDFTAAHALRAGRILGSLAREGIEMDPFDAMVAAVAVETDDVLVTRNVREFERVRGLRLRTY